MSENYHIGRDGTAKICSASVQECEFGAENHGTLKEMSKKSEEKLQEAHGDFSTTSKGDKKVSKENLASLVEEYDLDYGNSEVEFDENNRYITIEAPNHSTLPVDFEKEATVDEVRQSMVDVMDSFDPDEEFDGLWSPEFGNHNKLSPSEFMKILKEDKNSIRKNRKRSKKTSKAELQRI